MKTLFYIALSFIYLLAALTTIYPLLSIPVLAAARPDGEPVRDTSGDILRSGNYYYVISAARGMGGGLNTGESPRNRTCPPTVVQEHLDVLPGRPITFTPVDPKESGVNILDATNLNVKFLGISAYCRQSLVWRLERDFSGNWFVSTDGIEGNPSGVDTRASWFQIVKDNNDAYRLMFCPDGPVGRNICDYLGIYLDPSGKRHLALGYLVKLPLRVMFKRAYLSSSGSYEMEEEAASSDVLRTVV